MKLKFTHYFTVSLILLFSIMQAYGQTPAFTWDVSELTTDWADAGPATVIKESNGIKLEQIGTIGVKNTYIRINNSNNTNNVISLNSTSDALTITSNDEISHLVITYSSNGASSTSSPYVGFNSTPIPMGGDVANVTSCLITSGVTGTTGVAETYTPPAGTKFAVVVRGFACDGVSSPSREIRVYKIEVFTVSTQPQIDAFTVAGIEAEIDQSTKTITAELPYGSNLTALTPVVTLGGTATSYTPTGAVNFSAGSVVFTASGGGKSVNYTATITASTVASTDNTLKDLLIDDVTVTGFNPETLTYEIEYPFSYSGIPVVTAVKNDDLASVNIVQATAVPGTATVTVTAESGAVRTYSINFIRNTKSNACDILSFSINGRSGSILEETKTISVRLSLGTNVTALTPIVKISDLATYSPEGAQDFTNPVIYTVTAEDGTKKEYTVTVVLVDAVFNGPFPYETNFLSGYEIPDWMESPVGAISFVDPYGTPTTGSDKVLWYDNQTETDAGTASVIRISGGNPIVLHLSNCTNITAGLSSTGTRTYELYVNDELKTSSPSTKRDTKVTLSYAVNSATPVVIKIKSVETSSAITLGYLKIEGIATGLNELLINGVYFDGKIIRNENNIDIKVLDMTGRVIEVSNGHVDMSNFPTGFYVVKGLNGTLKIVNIRQ